MKEPKMWNPEHWKSEIQRAYDDLDYKMGWSMFGTPYERIRTAKVGIIGLNPGGDSGGAHWDFAGVAFEEDDWGLNNALQSQLSALLRALNLPSDDIFTANIVPFRSPNWAKLQRRREAVDFGLRLWRELLPEVEARVFICLGRDAAWYLAKELRARLVDEEYPTGWGDYQILKFASEAGKVVISLPHLSRFGIFERVDGRGDMAVASLRQAVPRDVWSR